MHPTILNLSGSTGIHSYGLFLFLGFSSATWIARRRAVRVGADPDVIFITSILAVLFGVGGARVLYVFHYWDRFADVSDPLMAILDFRRGGMEFLGGFVTGSIAIIAYLGMPRRLVAAIMSIPRKLTRRPTPMPNDGIPKFRPRSIRLYVDICAPSALWGLGITRLGCFLNGCCFGAVCMAPGPQEAQYVWAVQFPFASPAYVRQWEERDVTAPAELIGTGRLRLMPTLVNRRITAPPPTIASLTGSKPSSGGVADGADVRSVKVLASGLRTLPVHPTQLYSSIHALLLSGLLAALFRVRRRHGVVLATLVTLYPVGRILLEMIRSDNPIDTFGFTVSQFISLGMIVAGLLSLFVLYKFFPDQAPVPAMVGSTDPPAAQPKQRRSRSRKQRR